MPSFAPTRRTLIALAAALLFAAVPAVIMSSDLSGTQVTGTVALSSTGFGTNGSIAWD